MANLSPQLIRCRASARTDISPRLRVPPRRPTVSLPDDSDTRHRVLRRSMQRRYVDVMVGPHRDRQTHEKCSQFLVPSWEIRCKHVRQTSGRQLYVEQQLQSASAVPEQVAQAERDAPDESHIRRAPKRHPNEMPDAVPTRTEVGAEAGAPGARSARLGPDLGMAQRACLPRVA